MADRRCDHRWQFQNCLWSSAEILVRQPEAAPMATADARKKGGAEGSVKPRALRKNDIVQFSIVGELRLHLELSVHFIQNCTHGPVVTPTAMIEDADAPPVVRIEPDATYDPGMSSKERQPKESVFSGAAQPIWESCRTDKGAPRRDGGRSDG